MRMDLCARALATAGLALAGYMAAPSMSFGLLGIDSAEAAQFYTRKRVNGVWVTGQFPKAGGVAGSTGRRNSLRYGRRQLPSVKTVPDSASLTKLTLPDFRREPGPSTTGSTRAVAATSPAALPDIEAALVTAAIGPVAPVGAPPAAEERGMTLRRALERRAGEIAAQGAGEPIGIAVPVPGPGPADVAAAGEPSPAPASFPESASARAGTAAAVAQDGPRPGGLVPRSVSFDFETGIKTTVFESSVVKEPFDVVAMRSLTARSLSAR